MPLPLTSVQARQLDSAACDPHPSLHFVPSCLPAWPYPNPTQPGSPGFRAFKAVRPRLALQFEGLGLELHDGRTILSDITGRFEHSRVAAVMGPSGAGKVRVRG